MRYLIAVLLLTVACGPNVPPSAPEPVELEQVAPDGTCCAGTTGGDGEQPRCLVIVIDGACAPVPTPN